MIAFTLKSFKEAVYGPSGETKSEMILRTAEELGLKVINIKCTPMTEEDRKGLPRVISVY